MTFQPHQLLYLNHIARGIKNKFNQLKPGNRSNECIDIRVMHLFYKFRCYAQLQRCFAPSFACKALTHTECTVHAAIGLNIS